MLVSPDGFPLLYRMAYVLVMAFGMRGSAFDAAVLQTRMSVLI